MPVIREFEENRHVPNFPDSLIVSCNFDKGLCYGWSQSRADVFDWTLYSGSTPSWSTGPSSDHSGSGLRPLRRLFHFFFFTISRRPIQYEECLKCGKADEINTCLFHLGGVAFAYTLQAWLTCHFGNGCTFVCLFIYLFFMSARRTLNWR